MPKWIGNRFGSIVPIAPGADAPSAVYNMFDQYYSKQDGGWSNPSGITATGGVVSDYVDPGPGTVYRAHIFTSSGALDVTALANGVPNSVEYLIVAGGGAGGTDNNNYGAGGGAGGLLVSAGDFGVPTSQNQGAAVLATVQPYTITVGGGGAAANGENDGNDGSPSAFGPITVTGGGGGGGQDTAGRAGGSGGGGGGGGGVESSAKSMRNDSYVDLRRVDVSNV